MTTPQKATLEQWADAGAFASDTRACLLELRDRVAALEAAATPPPAPNNFPGDREMVSVLWIQIKPGPGCNASIVEWISGVEKLPIGNHILYAVTTPTLAPAGGLVGRMRSASMREFMSDDELSSMIHVVADWLQQRSDTIANGSQWAEILRKEADR